MPEWCAVEGCSRVHYAQGYCKRHYQRFLRHGDPLIEKRYQNATENAFAEWARRRGMIVSKRGWPDFWCLKDGTLYVTEVKPNHASTRSWNQQTLLQALADAGVSVMIWSPTEVRYVGGSAKRHRQ